MKIDLICEMMGHKMTPTFLIEETNDFYEVRDAKYCMRCGEINPEESKLLNKINIF